MMRPLLAAMALLCVAGCEVGPDYVKPSAPVPQKFKEADGWKPAEPKEAASGTAWWGVYGDDVLNGLERQIDVSNQSLKAAEAAYRASVAMVEQAQAQLFPTLSVSTSATRSGGRSSSGGTSAGSVAGSTGSRGLNAFSIGPDLSWEPDIWGKIRRTIEGDVATAQASDADIAAARLSAETTLATDYFELRVEDQLKRLLDDTIEGYRRSLQIAQNQYKAGTVAKTDVITAETQLEGTESQEINVGVMRAQLEHAIATLIGKPPAEFAIEAAPLSNSIPVIPTGVASTLLERRPDIAASERTMQSANAQIGVQLAAYYPTVTLSASYGFASSMLDNLFRASNAAWSFGGSATDTVVDFGLREGAVAQARATYDADVADYRQTVLTAFQEVEDQLAALRILEQQAGVEDQAVRSANLAVQLTLNQYKAGTVAYTSVVVAQTTALSAAQSLLTIHESRLTASVALIDDLGGGWSTADLSDAASLDAHAEAVKAASTP